MIAELEPVCENQISTLQSISANQSTSGVLSPRKITVADIKDPPENSERLINLLNSFRGAIALPDEPLGKTDVIEANIDTGDHRPLFTKQYPLPKKSDEIIEGLIQDMKKQGIVSETTSPWNSPVLLLRKKNGVDWRLVVDFRNLNKNLKAYKIDGQ